MSKWDKRFMALAEHIAGWSKDPSTQVGAIIVNDRRQVLGTGYNGFPRGVDDAEDRYNDRELKYKFVVHAEPNAILNAVGPVENTTIYVWPLFTCHECAKLIIQSGIKKVVARKGVHEERWGSSYELALTMYEESGVEIQWMN